MEFIKYFVSNYGYLAILILLLPGVFGIPLPDELLLTFVGYLALQGDLGLIPALAVVVAGAILGITLDYWVGRAAGTKLGTKLIKAPGAGFRLRPERLKSLEEQLHRYGGWGLCLGYFVPGVRHWVAITAGIIKFPLAWFTLFAYAGALAWSLLYILLGYFLGQEAGLWAPRLGAHGLIAATFIVALLSGYFLIQRKWRRRQRWPKIPGSPWVG
jgi:membrane protein DedA with SNARE-associated domain